jgi:hypothetical protein
MDSALANLILQVLDALRPPESDKLGNLIVDLMIAIITEAIAAEVKLAKSKK